MTLLDIKNLRVWFDTKAGRRLVVDGVDLSVDEGEFLGIAGESGSGKSVSVLAPLGLLERATVACERSRFDGIDLTQLRAGDRARLFGKDLSVIFQDPFASLNPCFTVGWQIDEILKLHTELSRTKRRDRALELLTRVGVEDAEARFGAYPHELSGGLCQRVMIAMAVACGPKLLIADEPTTALDVTVQKQVLDLLDSLRSENGMAVVLISHDLSLLSIRADKVQVMYAGRTMEAGAAQAIVGDPKHPYTTALLRCRAGGVPPRTRIPTIPEGRQALTPHSQGCVFAARCPRSTETCDEVTPDPVVSGERSAACHFAMLEEGRTCAG